MPTPRVNLSIIRKPEGPAPLIVQPLMGSRQPICFYEGEDHVPYVMKAPLTREDCEGFLSSDKGPVTFTAKVPLAVIANGIAAIVTHCEAHAFAFPVRLESCEFRPTGAVLGRFDEELCGEVLLQVTCSVEPC